MCIWPNIIKSYSTSYLENREMKRKEKQRGQRGESGSGFVIFFNNSLKAINIMKGPYLQARKTKVIDQ